MNTNITGPKNNSIHLHLYYASGHRCHSQNPQITLGSLLTPAFQFMIYGKAVVFVEGLVVSEYFILL